MNSTDNGNNKKSTYCANSQKRYGEKLERDGYLSDDCNVIDFVPVQSEEK